MPERYDSELAFMDATNKSTKHAIPLFFVYIHTLLHLKSNPQQFGLHLRFLQIASNSTLVKVQENGLLSAEQELKAISLIH